MLQGSPTASAVGKDEPDPMGSAGKSTDLKSVKEGMLLLPCPAIPGRDSRARRAISWASSAHMALQAVGQHAPKHMHHRASIGAADSIARNRHS